MCGPSGVWYCTSIVLFHVDRPGLVAVEAGSCQATRVVATPAGGSYATQLTLIVNAAPMPPTIPTSHNRTRWNRQHAAAAAASVATSHVYADLFWEGRLDDARPSSSVSQVALTMLSMTGSPLPLLQQPRQRWIGMLSNAVKSSQLDKHSERK